ncbi:hypothetical protein L873DRAFT_1786988 [Choiromyces venosus 120613-1]|uniref:Uncharacterized protein n=1 Tax=Choiromyces venosus 120613-1 TaxID=1336337 RepID=A0A3N4K586_9PEZI|nr:hypothetical protein L873DRAFT_1786988 [Choiromyces venosus 120613-1]
MRRAAGGITIVAPNFHTLCPNTSIDWLIEETTNRAIPVIKQPTTAPDHRLSADHLIDLYYNIYRAFESKIRTLGLTIQQIAQQDIISGFNSITLEDGILENLGSVEATSIPTPLTMHLPPLYAQHSCRSRSSTTFGSMFSHLPDPGKLCVAIMRSGNGLGDNGVLAWGDPWDPSNWEVTENLAYGWVWMFEDCGDIIHSTNKWKLKRGLVPLDLKVFHLGK